MFLFNKLKRLEREMADVKDILTAMQTQLNAIQQSLQNTSAPDQSAVLAKLAEMDTKLDTLNSDLGDFSDTTTSTLSTVAAQTAAAGATDSGS